MRTTTLCFLIDHEGRLLLGRKKRGFGVSKWNGFGGKIEVGETISQCAIRELQEETGLIAKEENLDFVGILDFQFSHNHDLNHLGYIYFIHVWEGNLQETEEMEPKWFRQEDIPFEEMWKGDRTWLPILLKQGCIQGTVVFAADNDTVQNMDIKKITKDQLETVRP